MSITERFVVNKVQGRWGGVRDKTECQIGRRCKEDGVVSGTKGMPDWNGGFTVCQVKVSDF